MATTDNTALPNTTGTAASALPSAGGTSSAGLSSWAAPYVTNMLAQGQALAATPYQAYQGPLTAGPSSIQQAIFSGIGGLTFPSNLGQSFASPAGTNVPMPNTSSPSETSLVSQAGAGQGFNQPTGSAALGLAPNQPSSIAQQYMNPYLQASLAPQLDALKYQAGINEQSDLSKLTQAGAYGGDRQAVLQGIDQGNLLAQQANLIGSGYNTAFNNAQNQFNTEQGQALNLLNAANTIGGQQQALNQAATTANVNEFNTQRQYPQQQLSFEQSLLSGLPIASVTNTPSQMSALGSLASTLGGLSNIGTSLGSQGLGTLGNDLTSALSNLGLNFGS